MVNIRDIASKTGLVKNTVTKNKEKKNRETRAKKEKEDKETKTKEEEQKLPEKYFKNLYDSYVAYKKSKSQESKNNISKNILLLLYYSKLQEKDITSFQLPGIEFQDDFKNIIQNLRFFDYYKEGLIDIHFNYIIDDKTKKQLDYNILQTETTDTEKSYENSYIDELKIYDEYVKTETEGRAKYLYSTTEYKDKQKTKKESYGYFDTDEPYENYKTIIKKQPIISKGLKEIALLKELDDNIQIFKSTKVILSNDSKKFNDIKIEATDKTNNYTIIDFILY